ncbi:competence factor transport protein ComB [Streptococcus pneumoniae]|nr:competence factor transport protein ComB [Streptococcus pneumoniae]
MKPEFLESAEFYNRRYHNFSSSVIVPMALLLVFLLGFATVAEKEMSLSTRATVEPSRILANIQSTSNNRILVNHLEENKLVKKGDLLVQYQEGAEGVQAESYASQLDMLKDQKKQLEYLQKSLQEGENHFPEEDKFGYQATFRDYISQAGSLRASTSQQNETIASQNAAASQTQAEIGNLISQTEAKIRDYQTAKSAMETGASLASQNLAYSLYQSYKSQGEENPQTKVQAVAQVEAQISQLESSLATYRVQYAGSATQQAYASGLSSQLESLKSQQAYASGLSSQLESLKSQHLAKVGQELTLLAQKILEAESGKKVQGNLLDKGKITASEDGVLHLNPETSDSSMVAEGALLAQLYPSLEREGKAKLTAYLSSKDVARIKVGDSVRYTTTHDAGNQLFLDSTITSIDATATKTEKGNFFKIEAETNLTSEQAEKLRYGVEGRLQMITGKKSYLRYYLDQFLNKE